MITSARPPDDPGAHRRCTFAPFVQLHRDAARAAGHDAERLPLSIDSSGYVADSSQQAADEYFPSYASMINLIERERGWSPLGRRDLDTLRSPRGALVVAVHWK